MNTNAYAACTSVTPEGRLLTFHNWVHLNRGDRITVSRPGHLPQPGTVDDVSDDASYFWARIDGLGRVLVFHGDGSVVHTFHLAAGRHHTSHSV
ncbi:hypothetical protein [Pseudarthrobacter chlorophenolicus]|uniref:hypothetical protein n=1 Tax=Pseudarthrobacter chlorophenolicus TaxID=85085 RepID=UPI0005F2B87F|nr:hypothetical protein [Pseudarthrobacter chlorophenolicus]